MMQQIESVRHGINNKVIAITGSDSSEYNTEPGRHYALEYDVLKKPAEWLAENGVPADAITGIGALFGVVGTAFLTKPSQIAEIVDARSTGTLQPSEAAIRVTGAFLYALSCFADLQDGAVARISENGETPAGKVFDGIVNKIIDTTPALMVEMMPENGREKLGWSLYSTIAPLSTMIRSTALAYDIPIPKTGIGSRVGTVATLSAGYAVEKWRGRANGWLGVFLTAQRMVDVGMRYKAILKSGNEEAIQKVNQDIIEYLGLALIGRISSDNPLVPFGLEMAKLLDVKVGEAYGERLSTKGWNKLETIFSRN